MGEIDFYNIKAANLRYWTESAKECYERNCICKNCDIFPKRFWSKCKMKSYVLALYTKFGKP